MKFNKPIVLISGPSGVGKTTLIKELCYLYPKIYCNIKSFTTRAIRGKKDDRIKLSRKKFLKYVREKIIILPNEVYGNLYGLSKERILNIISKGRIPICDWPAYMIKDFKKYFPEISILSVYLLPPNLNELKKRLSNDKRDKDNLRYKVALIELREIQKGYYNKCIDIKFLNKNGILNNALKLHSIICKSLNGVKNGIKI